VFHPSIGVELKRQSDEARQKRRAKKSLEGVEYRVSWVERLKNECNVIKGNKLTSIGTRQVES
jgi:hypothetical protein